MSTQVIDVTNPESLLALIIDRKQIEEYKAQSSPFLKFAQGFTIDDKSDYEYVLSLAEDAVERRKKKEAWIGPVKKLADLVHSLLCEMERQMIADDVEVERLIKERRKAWRKEQDRLDAEREIEIRRVAHEAEQARLLAEAAELETQGEQEAAEVVFEQAQTVSAPPVVVQSSVPKQAGSSIRKKYGYRIDDEEKVEREFCSPDPKKIKSTVDAYGMKAKIGGVTVFPDENEAIRTKGR